MATKSDYIALVNAKLPTGALIPATDHRDTMHTNSDSVGELVYMTPITDVSSGTKTITTSNANFSYTVTFTKVGRSINVKGTFENISGTVQAIGAVVFTIADAEYNVFSDSNANATVIGTGYATALVKMQVNPFNTFILISNVLDGEVLQFNFNYDALN